MRPFALLLFGACAIVSLTTTAPAAEIDVYYQVFAMERPRYRVSVQINGIVSTNSLHTDLTSAQAQEAKLESRGLEAWIQPIHLPYSRQIPDAAELRGEFDTLAEAETFADKLEYRSNLMTWIRKVEVIPGGP